MAIVHLLHKMNQWQKNTFFLQNMISESLHDKIYQSIISSAIHNSLNIWTSDILKIPPKPTFNLCPSL